MIYLFSKEEYFIIVSSCEALFLSCAPQGSLEQPADGPREAAHHPSV